MRGGGGQEFLGTKNFFPLSMLLGQGFRNNKKIVQELGTKIKD